MNEVEFDILDELYFVISFSELVDKLELDDEALVRYLLSMTQKNWIRVYQSPDTELEKDEIEQLKMDQYYYLASKEGLFAHNTNG